MQRQASGLVHKTLQQASMAKPVLQILLACKGWPPRQSGACNTKCGQLEPSRYTVYAQSTRSKLVLMQDALS